VKVPTSALCFAVVSSGIAVFGTGVGCSLDYGAFQVDDQPLVSPGGSGSGASSSGGSGSGASSSDGAGNTGAVGIGGQNANGGSGGGAGETPGGAGGSPTLDCPGQYGDLAKYEHCEATATTCTFYFHMNSSVSCNEACGDRGGECLSMHNDGTNHCDLNPAQPCSATSLNHAICVCSLGCGAGAACQSPETCSAGNCS